VPDSVLFHHGPVPPVGPPMEAPRTRTKRHSHPPTAVEPRLSSSGKPEARRPRRGPLGRSNGLFWRAIFHKGQQPRPSSNKNPGDATRGSDRQLPPSTCILGRRNILGAGQLFPTATLLCPPARLGQRSLTSLPSSTLGRSLFNIANDNKNNNGTGFLHKDTPCY